MYIEKYRYNLSILAGTKKRIFINLLLILFGLQVLSCDSNIENTRERLIPSVEAVQTHLGSLPLTERLTGIVKAKNQVEIYPEISAAITLVYVHNGDIIKKGQPLVKLRDKEFQDRLRQAKANYNITIAQAKQAEARFQEAKRELDRVKSMAEQGLASNADLENAQTQMVSADANLDLAKARIDQAEGSVEESEVALSQTLIRAPVSGTVGNRNAEIGMLVRTNNRLFTLGELENLKVEIVLTDRMLNYIEKGQRTEIFSEYMSSDKLEAPLTRISPFLHPVTHSTDAEIDLKNQDGILKPGMFVTVDVFYGESEQATLIPLSALYENPTTGETGVFVSKDKVLQETISKTSSNKSITLTNPINFQFVQVDILARGRMQAGISGIEPGSWVVTLGQNLLGSDSSSARVHPVKWSWIEELQNLQSQDLLKDIMDLQQQVIKDSMTSF